MLTIPLEDVFYIERARSAALSDYEEGPIPFLGNSFGRNPVAKYVTPFDNDRVFDFDAVVLSAFGETLVQPQPFIAYGAAGTSLTVLKPKNPMCRAELAFYAAWLATQMRGRFNWYYRSILSRIRRFRVPAQVPDEIRFSVQDHIPKSSVLVPEQQVDFQSFSIRDLFSVLRPKSGSFDDHESGHVAFVSNGEGGGVVGYVKPLEHEMVFHTAGITISAMSGAFVQAPPFIARCTGGSGLVVLQPRKELSPEQLLCVAADYNCLTRWRFSWSRQISIDRIKDLKVRLPSVNGHPDNLASQTLVRGKAQYWSLVRKVLTRKLD